MSLQRARTLLLMAFLLVVLLRIGGFALVSPLPAGDTGRLITHADRIRQCLSKGRYVGCDRESNFPLMQHLIVVPLVSAGATQASVVGVLTAVNYFSFLGILALSTWLFLRLGDPFAARAAAVVMLGGTLISYAQTPWGEMLAAFLTTVYVVTLIVATRPWFIGVAFAAAALSKETAPPFLAMLGAVATLGPGFAERLSRRSVLFALTLATAISAALAVAFNYFKFGVPYNAYNVRPEFIVPTMGMRASFFAAIWLSPAAGLFFFWPVFTVFFFSLAFFVLRRGRRLPIAGIAGVLGLLTAGLASWCAPFGWFCWGPRLILPWIPAALILLLWMYSAETKALLRPILSSAWRSWAMALLVSAVSFPQFAFLFGPGALGQFFGRMFVACGGNWNVLVDSGRYYQCMHHTSWTLFVWPSELLPPAIYPPATPYAICYLLGMGSLFLSLREPKQG